MDRGMIDRQRNATRVILMYEDTSGHMHQEIFHVFVYSAECKPCASLLAQKCYYILYVDEALLKIFSCQNSIQTSCSMRVLT